MIELKNITKIVADDASIILDKINLTIEPGEIFGLIGASGAGKTTLLRSINLLERPTEGQILINSIDVSKLDKPALRLQRRKIGYIFQQFNLLSSRTAEKNIALPLELKGVEPSLIKERVQKLLSLVKMEDKGQLYPEQLSGGQKQRIAIARALAADPEILLCDEPTSALDQSSTQSILNLLKEINDHFNITIVIVSHELDVIKQICHRVGIVHSGKLVEVGATLKIFSKPQHEATRQLVKRALHLDLKPSQKPETYLFKLTFVGSNHDEPLISTLTKKYDVTVNILQAQIETIQNTTVGFTVCEFMGTAKALEAALNYIESTSVHVEKLL